MPSKQRRAAKPQTAPAAARQARRKPEAPASGPQHYCAEVYHEIEAPGGGVLRVEVGHFVVTGADGAIEVMPPEKFNEASDAPASA
jgi:hypothetical protein